MSPPGDVNVLIADIFKTLASPVSGTIITLFPAPICLNLKSTPTLFDTNPYPYEPVFDAVLTSPVPPDTESATKALVAQLLVPVKLPLKLRPIAFQLRSSSCAK